MKKLIAIIVIFLLIGTTLPQEVNWFDGTFDEAKVKAEQEGKPILIEFFSESGWGAERCKLLDEQFFKNPDYADFINDNFIPMHAKLGTPKGNALRKKYFRTISNPTVLFADAEGREIDFIRGYDNNRVNTSHYLLLPIVYRYIPIYIWGQKRKSL